MNRSICMVPAMLCLAATVATAQTPAPDRPADTANKVTYTGCLKAGSTPGTWILESAEVAPKADAASAPSAVGTSGAAKMTFNLAPAATIDLKPHADHKVEVVGVVSPAKSGADASASTPGAKARQQFAVESFKMVSPSCP